VVGCTPGRLRVVDIAAQSGLSRATVDRVLHGPIGGGNAAILGVLEEVGRHPAVFVAHDLDADNRRLLRSRRISAVLHHDLRADMRRACHLLLQARGVLPGSPVSLPSQVQVVTPYNEPPALLVEVPTVS